MMMDWEVGGNGNVSGMVIAEEEDDGDEETTKHKLTSKWSSRIHDKTFLPAINSNPTDLSVSSHHHHLLRSTPTTTSASLHQYHHHHPFSNINTPPSASSSINGLSPKIAHLYVSTSSATTSSSSPSSSGSEGHQQLSPCISLDLTTTSSIKSESTNSSTNNKTTGSGAVRRPKPIPPPLDLSIGAANLSLNSPSLVTPTPTTLQRESHLLASYNNSFCSSGGSITNSPFYWASSPKFNQAEKTLPLRKRWHSWSPIQMNCPEDPMLPLYTDTHLMSIKQDRSNGDNHGLGLQNGGSMIQNGYGSSRASHASPVGECNDNQNLNNQQQANSMFNQSTGLQTPTPFYTPNEPSPKFMNSPVFSYSTPDTTLYQGPFSPIRSTILYPPTSPFMNASSSLNTPTFSMAPNVISTAPTSMTMSGINNSCFNMVPSTLLSPAPSQASTNSNSLSYEDLHEKSLSTSISSLNLFSPIWNIFMSGTRVRFAGGMNPLDWYFVDFLAQSGDSIGLKEDYAPNGLQVRTLVVPCSSKERISITFCPIADPHHPAIEVNCESGHPFMVEKKGWCAVKPDAFFETYGTHCQTLEGGDVCLSVAAASLTSKSPPQTHQQQHQQHPQTTQHSQNHNFTAQLCLMDQGPPSGTGTTPVSMTNGLSPSSSTLSAVDVKPVPISVIPQQPQTLPLPPQPIIQLRDPPIYNKKIGATLVPGGKRTNKELNNGSGEQKGRRPMNAFLLFAKDKRPELIQQYPGKDNRSISVLLGEAWQGLAPPEKEKYAASARLRAEEQKRMHPDCWKRKRSQSQPAV